MAGSKKNHSILKDILSIVILSLSVLLLLSLFSYDAHDPTLWNAAHGIVYHNMAGEIGANIADLFLLTFGIAGYIVGISGIVVFFALILKDKWEHRWVHITGLVLMVLSLSFTISSVSARTSNANLRNTGGLTGYYMSDKLHPYLGTVGTAVIAVTLLLISVIMVMRKPLSRFLTVVFGIAAAAAGSTGRFIRNVRTAIIVKREKKKRLQEKLEIKDRSQDIVIQPPKKKEQLPVPDAHKSEEAFQEVLFKDMPSEFRRPPLKLLDNFEAKDIEYSTTTLQYNARTIEKKLSDFNVNGKIINVKPGPVITMYEFEPAAGVKVSQIINLSDDLALAMKVPGVRIQSHIVGKSAVGIEVPNAKRRIVYLKEVLQSEKFQNSQSILTICLGVDATGEPVVTDLAKMPHLLIGGSTNSGKSVTMNAIIMSFLFKSTPDELKLILVDPKMLEFSAYNAIPHLLHEVITEPKKATYILRWATEEMDRRYLTINSAGARNIGVYNQMVRSKKLQDPEFREMPKIVIIIDELSDLMFTAPKEVEEYIIRLSQKARAAGIHIIFATQRPSVDVITGTIKSNFPSRIALKVPQKTDSRIILDQSGAEELLGAGDMLFLAPGNTQPVRVHGAYVSDTEVMRVAEYLRKVRKPSYEIQISDDVTQADLSPDGEVPDELYGKAVELIRESGYASISMLQRRLRVGYNRAARMVEQMEKEGIILRSETGNKNFIVSK